MGAAALDYSETIECHGVKVPVVAQIVTPRLQRAMRKNRYEEGEFKALSKILKPGDRVVDIGAGVGLISAAAAKIVGPANVIAVEANPQMVPMIQETHAVNGVKGVEVLNGVGVTRPRGKSIPFYLHENFWSSTMDEKRGTGEGYVGRTKVPEIDLNDLMARHRPTVMTVDIEGAELNLFDDLETTSLRSISMEMHPRFYGRGGCAHIMATLMKRGFVYDCRMSPGGSVVVLTRFRRKIASVADL